jgi:antitoxin VapB
VSLNIKNEHTHALVRRLADLTGSSQTSAVEEAVQRRLDEVLAERAAATEDPTARRARVEAILAAARADLTDAERRLLRRADADLYDESGLPR